MNRGAAIYVGLGLAGLFGLSLFLPLGSLPLLFHDDPKLAEAVLIELRMPRAVLALVYGAALGASGAAIQGLFANPLASPDITGTSGGAALGAVVAAYILGITSPLGFSIAAVAGALAALGLLLALAGPRADSATLLLAGVAISAATAAATTLALAFAPSPFAFYDSYDWLMGSLVDRSLSQAAFAAVPALAAVLVLRREGRALDRLALGEEVAESLGHDIGAMRLRIVVTSAVGIGGCVAVCGAIGFIGLVAPVLARRLTGGHPGRAILPAAAIGAALLVAADLASRAAPLGRMLPIGVITALLGAPFFLWLIVTMRWQRSA